MSKIMRGILAACLIGAIVISGIFAQNIQKGYSAEGAARNDFIAYKPDALPASVTIGAPDDDEAGREAFVNASILALKAEYEDAVGWLTIPFTGIDYPFVQAGDNSYYLNKDMSGEYLFAGSLFMDCRNDSGFFDSNTVIYGHHMKNGTMFGSLAQFGKEDFFDANKSATIYLADKTYAVEFFAYLVVDADDSMIYDEPADGAAMLDNLSYIRENARQYREVEVGSADQLITLSTCAYEFKEARMVLIGKLAQIQ